jgi:tetratricopeptide (TPR) repeat protein
MRFCLFLVGVALWAQQTPVIMISVDTLRADRLSAYGYRKQRTPNLDSFAERGTLYANAACATPLTLPSHTSLFTSTYPYENRVQENAEPVPHGLVTLASVLKQHGYRTAAFIGSVFLERRMGLDQGFDDYDSPFDFRVLSPMSGELFYAGESRNPYAVRDRRDGAIVIASATRWLNAHQGQPVFVFLHLFDMHLPYQHGADYDAQLAYVDQALGTFKQSLVRSGWWDRSLVVLLSDHGESLGDHGEASHGYFIYQSTMAVPLMIHWPSGGPSAPAREERLAGLIDVAPTILDYLRVPAPASFRGQSLLGRGKAVPLFGESVHAYDAFGWAPLRSLRSGDYKFIEAPRPELYNLAADPGELHNLAVSDPGRVQSMRTELSNLLGRLHPKGPEQAANLSARERALLGSLGYVAPGPQTAATGTRPDPKDRMSEFRRYEDAQVLLYQRRLPEAIAALRKIVLEDPQNILARRDLGGAYIETKQYGKAREELARVLLAAPKDYVTQYQLGLACEHSGLLPQAREHLEAACAIAPDSVPCKSELEAVLKRLK